MGAITLRSDLITYGLQQTVCLLSRVEVPQVMYRVIQKDGLNFVRLYFLNYTWYVNDLHNV